MKPQTWSTTITELAEDRVFAKIALKGKSQKFSFRSCINLPFNI